MKLPFLLCFTLYSRANFKSLLGDLLYRRVFGVTILGQKVLMIGRAYTRKASGLVAGTAVVGRLFNKGSVWRKQGVLVGIGFGGNVSELIGVFWVSARISGLDGAREVDEVVDWLVKDSSSCQMSPAVNCLPSKGLSHLCCAAVSRIIPSDEPQGATLYCFERCNVLLFIEGPCRSDILDPWSNWGVIGLFFDLRAAVLKISV